MQSKNIVVTDFDTNSPTVEHNCETNSDNISKNANTLCLFDEDVAGLKNINIAAKYLFAAIDHCCKNVHSYTNPVYDMNAEDLQNYLNGIDWIT